MILDQTLQFSGVAPMDNLKPKVSTLLRNRTVPDLAQHQIVAALDPIYLTSPRLIQFLVEMNPDATR
jgi:hypothetical protein